MNKFHSERIFISPTMLTQYPTRTIDYVVLYYNRFIRFSTQIILKNKH